ncbi:MAG: DNA cytosine methyltransferase [Planctomycetota bacterium]
MIARATRYPTLLEPRIVDLFAGAGGASTGIEEAFTAAGLDRGVDVAINHDPDAIACHALNHPLTHHLQADVFEVDPDTVEGPIGLLWASPDCTDFSKAKGGRPIRSTKRRSLAWVVVHWAFVKRPEVIMLENVEEFQQWGPIDDEGKPVRDGSIFEGWVESLNYLGYAVEWRELRACDYGTPTTRKRLFVVARRDGLPIVWPEKTHGGNAISGCCTHKPRRTANPIDNDSSARLRQGSMLKGRRDQQGGGGDGSRSGGAREHIRDPLHTRPAQSGELGTGFDGSRRRRGLTPYRTAADIIDWSLPMLSIFATPDEAKAWAKAIGVPTPRRPLADNTLRRIARGLVKYVLNAGRPFLVPYHREREDQAPRVRDLEDPLATVATAPMGLVDAGLAPYVVGAGGSGYAGKPVGVDRPMGVVKGDDRRGLVAAFIAKHYGGVTGHGCDRPIGSVTNIDHHALTTAYLTQTSNTNGNGDYVYDAGEPMRTVTRCHDQQLVAAHLSHMYTSNTAGGQGDLRQPKKTVLAGANHAALVASFLTKFYGNDRTGQATDRPLDTIPGLAKFGLVTVMLDGEPWVVTDLAMRMLSPRELASAQGFRSDYVIDRAAGGKRLSKRTQVRLIGNSVCRHVARALVESNVIGVCDWAQPQLTTEAA